ncbi:MAG: 4-oxalocrotonate tautomerase family protein [Campylobacter sp.]|nr:4-oxalocrotonate tautomerase family protein [Campylobacter sp.]
MPLINVKMTLEDGGLSTEQKQDLARELTDAFVRVVGRGEKTCVVIIDELSTDNYAIGGETITNIRKKQI